MERMNKIEEEKYPELSNISINILNLFILSNFKRN